ncbi:aspartic peptidase domain-containing protein [Phlebopus sp. FC_14]|nr:aspartic peptidase domain-containing protein [Phlebopus sp. FC_14]
MFSPNFVSLALISYSVVLASNALVISRDNNTDSSGFKGFPFKARLTPKETCTDNSSLVTVTNKHNIDYLGKVTVGGREFTLQLDTGSSDLWVTGFDKLNINKNTNTDVNLTYGVGSAAGDIVYADVSFGGYYIQNQALVNATSLDQQDDEGIIGLGFNGKSEIAEKINDESGRTVMANIFNRNPETPIFLALALERTEDGEDTSGGVLSIGEYDPDYSHVSGMPKHPVKPSAGSRWTIAMNGMTVNGKSINLKSNDSSAQSGTAVALIDSGTSFALIPPQGADAIYSSIEGAVHIQKKDEDDWYVPCLGQTNLSFTFGQETFPINPMDLTSPTTISDRGKQYTVCVSTFQAPQITLPPNLDFLLGDVFMRNVYNVFNFGHLSSDDDDSEGASIQFLSRTDRDQVYQQFEECRKESLKNRPPLLDLSKLRTDGSIA